MSETLPETQPVPVPVPPPQITETVPAKDLRFVLVMHTPSGLKLSWSSDKTRLKSVAKELGVDLMDTNKNVVLRGKQLKPQRHTYTSI